MPKPQDTRVYCPSNRKPWHDYSCTDCYSREPLTEQARFIGTAWLTRKIPGHCPQPFRLRTAVSRRKRNQRFQLGKQSDELIRVSARYADLIIDHVLKFVPGTSTKIELPGFGISRPFCIIVHLDRICALQLNCTISI